MTVQVAGIGAGRSSAETASWDSWTRRWPEPPRDAAGCCCSSASPASASRAWPRRSAMRAPRRGATIAWGRAWEAGGAPAYWPWIEVLRGLLLDRIDRSAPGLAAVAQILPELRDRMPDLPAPPPLEPAQALFRLYDAVASLLRHLARDAPLVIILDDLHAADVPTLALLHFVARGLPARARAGGRLLPRGGGAHVARRGRRPGPGGARGALPARWPVLTASRWPAGCAPAAWPTRSWARSFSGARGKPTVRGRAPASARREAGLLGCRARGRAIPLGVRDVIRDAPRRMPGRGARRCSIWPRCSDATPTSICWPTRPARRPADPRDVWPRRWTPTDRRRRPGAAHASLTCWCATSSTRSCRRRAGRSSTWPWPAAARAARGDATRRWPSSSITCSPRRRSRASTAPSSGPAAPPRRPWAGWPSPTRSACSTARWPRCRRDATRIASSCCSSWPRAQIGAGRVDAGHETCLRAVALARRLGDADGLARAALTYGGVFVFARMDRGRSSVCSRRRWRRFRPRTARCGRSCWGGWPRRCSRRPIRTSRWRSRATPSPWRAGWPSRPSTSACSMPAPPRCSTSPIPAERIPLNRELVALAGRLGDKVRVLRGHLRLVVDYLEAGDGAWPTPRSRSWSRSRARSGCRPICGPPRWRGPCAA